MFEANNDHQLARLLFAGDPAAYEFVVRSIGKKVIRRLTRIGFSREDADDIWSDCQLKLWESFCEGYDPDRSSFMTWVLTVAHNRAVDYLRSNQRLRFVSLEQAKGIADSDAIYKKYSGRWDWELVERAIQTLKESYKDVIDLKFGQGLTNTEISRLRQKSPAAVNMAVRRAVQKLRIEVERLNNHDRRQKTYRARSPDSA